MDAEDIIHTIQEAERRKQVFKYSAGSRGKQNRNPHWQLSLVNDPKAYQTTFGSEEQNKEPGFFKFKVSSLEEGKKICKDIFDFHEISTAEIVAVKNIDTAKSIYLIVQILYSTSVEENRV